MPNDMNVPDVPALLPVDGTAIKKWEAARGTKAQVERDLTMARVTASLAADKLARPKAEHDVLAIMAEKKAAEARAEELAALLPVLALQEAALMEGVKTANGDCHADRLAWAKARRMAAARQHADAVAAIAAAAEMKAQADAVIMAAKHAGMALPFQDFGPLTAMRTPAIEAALWNGEDVG